MVVLLVSLAGCVRGGTSLDASEYFERTADRDLAAVVARGDRDAVHERVRAGADPDVSGLDGRTMLDWALDTRSLDGLTALLEAGADPDRIGYRGDAAVHRAAGLEEPAFLAALLRAGADPDVVNPHSGVVALVDACVETRESNLATLLEAGADVDAADPNGGTPLHACGRLNQGAMVLRLLEAGADPLAEDSTGATFQDYYFGWDPALLTDGARQARAAVAQWLERHDVPVSAKA